MSDAVSEKFGCDGCGKLYALKPELSGKRVKCKCGSVITVPTIAVEPEETYDLAEEPKVAVAPVMRAVAAPAIANPGGANAAGKRTLNYRSGPTKRDRDAAKLDNTVDKVREVYVPTGLLVVGFLMLVGYAFTNFGGGGATVGLYTAYVSVMTILKTIMMVGFAFIIAPMLDVSFGGVWTAILKLAAISVFTDGCSAFIDLLAVKLAGPMGGGGMLSGSIAIGIIWILMAYLFSMDAGDAWLVVILMGIFRWLAGFVLIMLLAALFMSGGGGSLIAGGANAAAALTEGSEAAFEQAGIAEMIANDQTMPAIDYINDRAHHRELAPFIPRWKEAGAEDVLFTLGGSFGARATAGELVVILPSDPEKRKACFDIYKEAYKAQFLEDIDPTDPKLIDEGQKFLIGNIRLIIG
jgi:23S rRNA pseudoU1915 N3-methylase RlmH